MNIDEPSTAATPFNTLGGESQVLALAERFYDLMDLEPAYAALRAAHGSTLAQARQKLFWYLCGWLGGPQHYTERFGHPRLRARHMPFVIGNTERDQWLACMDQAMQETGVPDDLRLRLDAQHARGLNAAGVGLRGRLRRPGRSCDPAPAWSSGRCQHA
jgi:hemoglobin